MPRTARPNRSAFCPFSCGGFRFDFSMAFLKRQFFWHASGAIAEPGR